VSIDAVPLSVLALSRVLKSRVLLLYGLLLLVLVLNDDIAVVLNDS
jgi:hypothetical protein